MSDFHFRKQSFLATSTTIPKLYETHTCFRMTPLLDESLQQLIQRMTTNDSTQVTESIRTSRILKVSELTQGVYHITTRYFVYIIKVGNTNNISRKSYLAYSDRRPRVNTQVYCYYLENDDFSKPVKVRTDIILSVKRVAKAIYQVETEKSHYFMAVITG